MNSTNPTPTEELEKQIAQAMFPPNEDLHYELGQVGLLGTSEFTLTGDPSGMIKRLAALITQHSLEARIDEVEGALWLTGKKVDKKTLSMLEGRIGRLMDELAQLKKGQA